MICAAPTPSFYGYVMYDLYNDPPTSVHASNLKWHLRLLCILGTCMPDVVSKLF